MACLPRARVDNSPDAWRSPSPLERDIERRASEAFGPEQFVSFARTGLPAFGSDEWRDQRELASRLEGVEGVTRVDSLPGVLESLGLDASEPPGREAQDALIRSPVVQGALVGRGGDSFRVIAWVEDTGAGGAGPLLARLRRAAAGQGEWEVGGPIEFNDALDGLVREDFLRIALLLPLAILAGGLAVLRSTRAILGAAIGALAPCVAWLGLCAGLGIALNGAQLGVLPFLAVVGMENAVHLRAEAEVDGDGWKAARRLHRRLLLTGATTALSLLALCSSGIAFLRVAGWTAALGTVASWATTRYLLPGIIAPRARVAGHSLAVASSIRVTRPMAAGILLLVIAAGAAAVPRLRQESNIARQLPPGSELAQSIARADEAFGASMALRVLSTPVLPWMSPMVAVDSGETIGAAAREAAGTGQVQVIGPAAWLELASALGALEPAQLDALAAAREHDALFAGFDPSRALSAAQWLLWRERLAAAPGAAGEPGQSLPMMHGRTAAFVVLLPQLPGERVAAVLAALGARDESNGAFRTNRAVVGALADVLRVQDRVLGEAARTFILSLLLVALTVALLLRSPGLALAGLAVNVAPFAATLSLFAITGWAMDMTSAQLFSMLLGYVVNSTVFMAASRGEEGGMRQGARSVLRAGVLGAILFSTLAFASLPSLRHFGLLAGATTLLACAADVVLLPALLGRERASDPGRLDVG